jgi:hypothetical protein
VLRDSWQAWCAYRDGTDGALRPLLCHPNPEVVFSTLDILRLGTPAGSDETDDERRAARQGLLHCVHEFFIDRHAGDGSGEGRERRHWVHERLSELDPGDVVITLNWDTTVERTLAEMGRWNPTTGYGFEKPLAPLRNKMPNFFERPTADKLRLIPSAIHVLKRHGSCGWHRKIAGEFYFDHYEFLDRFGFVADGGRNVYFADPENPDYGLDGPVLLYPSFVKQLDDQHLLTTWREAHKAVQRAELVDVYGYSLPMADGAIRVLLAPLRQRSEEGAVRIHVREMMPDAQERWRALLGPSLRLSRP